MSFNLVHIYSTMGPLAKAIAFVLVFMAIACAGVIFERILAFTRSTSQSRQFAKEIQSFLSEWRLEEIPEKAKRYKHSVLARAFANIIRRYSKASNDREGRLAPSELARGEAERQKEMIDSELRRGLGVLASVGSVAPFVGLLGTVVGIIGAFQGISTAGSGGLAAVSAGIAEALIETALGLMVAIPAVLLFNWLSTRVNSIQLVLSNAVGELLDEMENHDGEKSEGNQSRRAA